MQSIKKIGILGFGNMGQSIFTILKKNRRYQFYIHSKNIKTVKDALYLHNIAALIDKSDIVFLCIKPQDFHQLKRIVVKNKKLIVISIMAGVRLATIQKKLGTKRVVRTMPNLALKIGKAVIGYYTKEKYFRQKEIKEIEKIMAELGKIIAVQKESMIDNITAVSGSGPAYIFLFTDAIIKASEELGFKKSQAFDIVAHTILGSISYLEKEKNGNIEEIIARVASKGGTTEAALSQIDIKEFYNTWQRAIKKAAKRAAELSI